MERRCIFCMEALENEQGRCASCGRMQWEYEWKQIYLPPYTVLNRKYEIGAVLGLGSSGITYLGYDKVLAHKVAVKEFFPGGKTARDQQSGQVLIPEAYTREFEEGRKTFREEAALIYGAFDMPGICNVKDYFEENGTAYLVEEYLSGGTFRKFLNEQSGHKVSFEECQSLFAPVLEGLCCIHAMGVVHRDISPDNLMFDGQGNLKLIDFGAAKDRNREAETIQGKDDYAPLEQYYKGQMVGPWSDLYAVCSVMYQALTGNKPVSSLKRMKKDTLVPVSFYTEISESAEAGLRQGMALDIQRRYFYAGNLMEKLGMDTKTAKIYLEKIRNIWGEDWLKIVTEKNTDLQAGHRRRFTRKHRRQFLTLSLAVILACGCFAGGLWYYAGTHQEAVFRYKVEKAREYEKNHPQKRLLLEGTPEFARVLEEIEPYEVSESWENPEYHSYNLPASALKKLKLLNVGAYYRGKFYLDDKTIKKVLEYFFDQKLELKSSNFYISISMDLDQRYGLRTISNGSTQHDTYGYKDSEGREYELEISSDPADSRVKGLEIKGGTASIERFLKNILPYVVPEIYLTDEEIDDFLVSSREAYGKQASLSEEETIQAEEEIKNHAKAVLKLKTIVSPSYAYSSLTVEPNGIPPEG